MSLKLVKGSKQKQSGRIENQLYTQPDQPACVSCGNAHILHRRSVLQLVNVMSMQI